MKLLQQLLETYKSAQYEQIKKVIDRFGGTVIEARVDYEQYPFLVVDFPNADLPKKFKQEISDTESIATHPDGNQTRLIVYIPDE